MDYDALAEQWQAFGADTSIYLVDPTLEPLDDLVDLARRAGLDDPRSQEWTDLGPVLEIEQHPQVFSLYRASRAVQWVDVERWQHDDGRSNLSITDDDAVDAARRVVDRLGLDDGDTYVTRRVTRLHVGSGAAGGDDDRTRIVDVGVVLARTIDGLPAEGQGGTIVVYLDARGEVTGFERTARRIAGTYSAVESWRPLDDVLTDAETHWQKSFGEGLSVDAARLAYLELGRLQEQELIQPVYVLGLTLAIGDDGDARTVDHVVPAATNGVGPLMPTDAGPRSGRR